MKTGFSLWELTHMEFPVSYTGFGFAVQISTVDSPKKRTNTSVLFCCEKEIRKKKKDIFLFVHFLGESPTHQSAYGFI